MINHQIPKTIILRHRKENLKKCSLRGLESRQDMEFFTYPQTFPKNLNNYFILSLDGEELSKNDAHLGIFLIDGTWKLAEKMINNLPEYPTLKKRSLPKNWRTAYPRVQTGCNDPERGLASLEALYATYFTLQRSTEGLLDNYHFGKDFLNLNKELLTNSLSIL